MARTRVCPVAAVLAASLLAGCAPPQHCLLAGQQPMLKIDLYFGRDIPGHAPVSDAEWARFAAHELAHGFPDGFTVLDASGQWLSTATHHVVHEPTKLVEVVTPGGPDLAARVQAVIGAYKTRFKQESVGVVSAPACAAF